jgi:hypothetical protein
MDETRRRKGVVRVAPGNKIVAGGKTLEKFLDAIEPDEEEYPKHRVITKEELMEYSDRIMKEVEEDLKMLEETPWQHRRPLPSFRQILRRIFRRK